MGLKCVTVLMKKNGKQLRCGSTNYLIAIKAAMNVVRFFLFIVIVIFR
jgi:hypothetical protein